MCARYDDGGLVVATLNIGNARAAGEIACVKRSTSQRSRRIGEIYAAASVRSGIKETNLIGTLHKVGNRICADVGGEPELVAVRTTDKGVIAPSADKGIAACASKKEVCSGPTDQFVAATEPVNRVWR